MKVALPPYSLITFLTGRFSGMIHSSAINVRESNPAVKTESDWWILPGGVLLVRRIGL
jgi:hypothetical protein